MAVACKRPAIGWTAAGLWLLLAFQFGQGAVSPQVNAVLTFGHTLASLVLVFAIVPRLVDAPAAAAVIEPPAPLPA